ncbi:MAG: hypothetical protein ABIH42_00705 [Planctomycetota bacterium]
MNRVSIILIVLFFIVCGCRNPDNIPPTVIEDVDFKFDTIWKALCSAVEARGFEIYSCDKDDRKIVSYYKEIPEPDIRDSWVRSKKVEITLVPNKAPTIVKYDIRVFVGIYYKSKKYEFDLDEDWDYIRRDGEIEKEIVGEFHRQISFDQRIRQGHEEYEKRPSRGY